MDTQPSIVEQLESVPLEPGCYLWKNAAGEILYVGKAKVLRARMKQYVQGTDERAKIPFMMEQVASFDYVVCSTETEALVLEKNLIQQFHPPFNVDYRDDKSYP
ncbi:MAG: GIY-YIG nuclease family protein, partial [Coriobacteriales bacterium]